MEGLRENYLVLIGDERGKAEEFGEVDERLCFELGEGAG